MPCIYKIQNKINGKIYIGQTKRTLEWRLHNTWCGHFHKLNSGSKSYLSCALRKYGKENFTYDVIEEKSYDDFENKQALVDWLNSREQYWISYYKSNKHDFGYNKTKGGQTGKPDIDYSVASRRMTEYNNKRWADADFRKRRSAKVSKQFIELWKTEEFRQQVIGSMRKPKPKCKCKPDKDINELFINEHIIKRNPERLRKLRSNRMLGNTNVKGRIHVHTDTDFRMIKPEQLENFLARGYTKGTGRSYHRYLTEEQKQQRKQRMIERGTLDKLRDMQASTKANTGCKHLYKDGIKKIFKKEEVEQAIEDGWMTHYDYVSSGGKIRKKNSEELASYPTPKFKLLYKEGKQKRVKLEEYNKHIIEGWLPYKDYLASGGQLSWRFPKRSNNENKIKKDN